MSRAGSPQPKGSLDPAAIFRPGTVKHGILVRLWRGERDGFRIMRSSGSHSPSTLKKVYQVGARAGLVDRNAALTWTNGDGLGSGLKSAIKEQPFSGSSPLRAETGAQHLNGNPIPANPRDHGYQELYDEIAHGWQAMFSSIVTPRTVALFDFVRHQHGYRGGFDDFVAEAISFTSRAHRIEITTNSY